MHLLDPYFFIRDCVWWLRSPKASRKWRGTPSREYLVIPEPNENKHGLHEIQSINVRPTGESKGVVRTESDGHIVFREFYFQEDRLVAVREYGWVVDFFLPRRAMVRWRNEVDTSTTPYRRRGRTKYFALDDSEIQHLAATLRRIALKHNEANRVGGRF